ncbi:hypothetical protein KP77_25230 [Jeotgalibacillus alimentarius]|uniref:Uncharacterized protein n=1 Tax=Jeotgalibacillus alimentarius TaxID=135826 RepID=A0A0C2RYT0_9BACL|nr:hypothetical protein [Jeotgalibacillus alimentarius]KIL46954.1 hypothetical protein KP77_25230 [Jeotgalibacillus alimentarius]
MCRIVTEHTAKGTDYELLAVVTVFEEGINKQTVKKLNRFSHKRLVLIDRAEGYEVKA